MMKTRTAISAFLAVWLGACGGGGGGGSIEKSRHAIGGKINGLASHGLTLVNGSDAFQPLMGETRFVFSTTVPEGAAYAVSVAAQPTTLDQFCGVSNGQGVVGKSDIDNVSVECHATSWGATKVSAANLPDIPGAFALASDRTGGWYVGAPYAIYHLLASGAVRKIGPTVDDAAGNPVSIGHVSGLVVGADGALYLTDWSGNKIGRAHV